MQHKSQPSLLISASRRHPILIGTRGFAYYIYFVQYLYSVSLIWRFLISSRLAGLHSELTESFLGQRESRSDSTCCESLLLSPPINIEGVIPNEVRDLIWFIMFILQNTFIKSVRNLTINYFEIIIDNRYS
jgi:hypothetical protein